MEIPVKIYSEGATALPKYQTAGSAGMDLFAAEEFEFRCGERKLVSTGVYLAIPNGHEGQIRSQGKMATKRGLCVLDSPSTVSCDFRDEVKVLMINQSQSPQKIEKGERFAQIVFAPYAKGQIQQVGNKESLG